MIGVAAEAAVVEGGRKFRREARSSRRRRRPRRSAAGVSAGLTWVMFKERHDEVQPSKRVTKSSVRLSEEVRAGMNDSRRVSSGAPVRRWRWALETSARPLS